MDMGWCRSKKDANLTSRSRSVSGGLIKTPAARPQHHIPASVRWVVAGTLGMLWSTGTVEGAWSRLSRCEARRVAPCGFAAVFSSSTTAFFLPLGGGGAGFDDDRRRWWPGRKACGGAGVHAVRKKQPAGVVARLWVERATLPAAGESMVGGRGRGVVRCNRDAWVVLGSCGSRALLHVVGAKNQPANQHGVTSQEHHITSRQHQLTMRKISCHRRLWVYCI